MLTYEDFLGAITFVPVDPKETELDSRSNFNVLQKSSRDLEQNSEKKEKLPSFDNNNSDRLETNSTREAK